MKRKTLIIIGIIAAMFIIPLLIPRSPTACTMMYCQCINTGPSAVEAPCNSCSSSKIIFSAGIITLIQSNSGKEILTCENGEQTGRRIEPGKSSYDWYFMNRRIG
jgi:hypothetical protein